MKIVNFIDLLINYLNFSLILFIKCIYVNLANFKKIKTKVLLHSPQNKINHYLTTKNKTYKLYKRVPPR